MSCVSFSTLRGFKGAIIAPLEVDEAGKLINNLVKKILKNIFLIKRLLLPIKGKLFPLRPPV